VPAVVDSSGPPLAQDGQAARGLGRTPGRAARKVTLSKVKQASGAGRARRPSSPPLSALMSVGTDNPTGTRTRICLTSYAARRAGVVAGRSADEKVERCTHDNARGHRWAA
jgi:hypothetical protein